MKTIRISMDVWEMLKRLATPLEDTPDSVLKRVLGEFLVKKPEPPVISTVQDISSHVRNLPPISKENTTNKQSGKEKGRNYRRIFLQELESKGIFLTRIKENIYRNKKGELIGIPYSSEQKPNEWFLGLPENNYDYLVFLCEKDSQLLNFIIPRRFYKDINFSRCKKDGDLKFNITKMNYNFYLDSPGNGRVVINEFLNNYNVLK